MLNEFVKGSLPGEPSFLPAVQSDVATFKELWEVGNAVFSQCVVKKEPLEMESEGGWSYAGKSSTFGCSNTRL